MCIRDSRTRSPVIHIGIYQIQVGTLCNVGLANLNLICDDIHPVSYTHLDVYKRQLGLIMRANNDNRPETLLAIVDAAAAERVVRLASPVIQEE